MPKSGISERIREFIFNHVDSFELLDVLFILRADPNRFWSVELLSKELRSNPSSIESRIQCLKEIGLISENPSVQKEYFYQPKNEELDSLITELFDVYQIKKHSLLELIFSPLKKARDFSDAFRFSKQTKIDGDDNG